MSHIRHILLAGIFSAFMLHAVSAAPAAPAAPKPAAPSPAQSSSPPRSIAELKARGYVDCGTVTKERTAVKIAGKAWKSPTTFYTIRNKVIPGNSLDPARIEKDMHVWMKK